MYIKRTVIAITTVAITSFYYLFDPATFRIGLPCILNTVTGWDCWGCGGQRAFHQLLHGNFQEAFYLNALVFPVTVILAYAGISELFLRQSPSYKFLQKRPIQISTIIVVATFTVLRNAVE